MPLTNKQRGLITVFGGFTVHLVMGAVFMWGTLNVYITSYFRQLNDQGLSLSVGGAIFPVMMVCVATGMPIGIKAISIVSSPRIYCICASVVSCTLIYFSSYANYFWQYVLIYGVGFGLVSGTLYFIPIYIGYLYFPQNKGFVSGTVLAGYGLCSLVFGLSFFAIVNPDDLSQVSDPDGYSYFQGKSISVAQNVPSTIRFLSWIYLGVSVFGSCFIMKHPSQEKQSKSIDSTKNEVDKLKVEPQKIDSNIVPGAPSPSAVFKQPQFYVSLVLSILAIGFGVIINGNYKSVAKDFGFTNDSYQSLVGALVSTANGISRPFWSNLVDKFTFKQILTSIIILQVNISEKWRQQEKYAFSFANLVQFLIVYFLKPKIGFTNIFYIYAGLATATLVLLHTYTFQVDWSKYYIESNKVELIKGEGKSDETLNNNPTQDSLFSINTEKQ